MKSVNWTYREHYNQKLSMGSLIFLALHLPLFLLVGKIFETSLLFPLCLAGLLLGLGFVSYLRTPQSAFNLNFYAVTAICFSGILIHLGRGMIELHFHIFVLLGLLPLYGYLMPLLLAAGTAAVHHIGFYFLLPSSVFNYNAGLEIVAVHALFVVAQTGFCLFIANKTKKFIEVQSQILPHLENWAPNLLESGHRLSDVTHGLVSARDSQAEAVQETKEALNQLASGLEQSIKMLKNVVDQGQNVYSQSEQTSETISRLEKTMREVAESSKNLVLLSSLVNQIGEKTKIIDQIVFETKILSFNASVEAERAGEHGRGFSVVAHEVGNLAKLSGDSAREITEIVNKAVKQVNGLVEVNQKLVEKSLVETIQSAEQVKSMKQAAEEIQSKSQESLKISAEGNSKVVFLEKNFSSVRKETENLGQMVIEGQTITETIKIASEQMKDSVEHMKQKIA